jgi:hypothetical protein
MLIQRDPTTGKSLYTVLFFTADKSIDELHFHARSLLDARRIATRHFRRRVESVIEVGLTIGAREDASGIYI